MYIRNQSCGKVLEAVQSGNQYRVALTNRKSNLEDSQLWYEDSLGIIRSRIEDFYLVSNGKENLDMLCMQPHLRRTMLVMT